MQPLPDPPKNQETHRFRNNSSGTAKWNTLYLGQYLTLIPLCNLSLTVEKLGKNFEPLICNYFMDSIGWVNAASFPQRMFWFCRNEARHNGHYLDLELCIMRLGDVLTEGNFITYDSGKVVDFLNCCIRRRSAAVFVNRFQFFYCKLVWGVFKERYPAFSNFHLSMNTSNRVEVTIDISSAIIYFHTEIINNVRDSFVNGTFNSYA